MNASPVFSALLRSLTLSVLLSAAATTLAAEPPATPPSPSKEMREKMAMIHQNMAACLRSDKALAECQQQMHRNCAEVMGEQSCPMMGMGPHKRETKPAHEH